MYLELHQIIKPSSTTSHMHIVGLHRSASDNAPGRTRMRRSARGVSLYVILSYVTYHPRSVIAPGSDRIRRALRQQFGPKQSRTAQPAATARRLVNCGWSLSRYVAHSFIHRNTH